MTCTKLSKKIQNFLICLQLCFLGFLNKWLAKRDLFKWMSKYYLLSIPSELHLKGIEYFERVTEKPTLWKSISHTKSCTLMTVLMFLLYSNKIVIFLCTLSKKKCKHKFIYNLSAENKICSCNGFRLRNQTLQVRNKSVELANSPKVM